MLGAFGWGSDGEDKGGAEEEEGEEEEVQDFGIRQGLMLAVAFVMDRVTAMCQLPLRVAVECVAQQSGCGESRL